MRVRAAPIAAAVAAALVLAPAAAAHVTLNPREWEADGFARFAIRVPNEREDAATTRVTLRFPEQILSASFQPIEGWRRTVKMARLDEPIEVEGERVTERIDTVTWSGGRIRPGEFEEFGVSFRTPNEPGTELAFPAVQTYSSGEVVRWIGPPDADEPAPRVAITEPEPEGARRRHPPRRRPKAPAATPRRRAAGVTPCRSSRSSPASPGSPPGSWRSSGSAGDPTPPARARSPRPVEVVPGLRARVSRRAVDGTVCSHAALRARAPGAGRGLARRRRLGPARLATAVAGLFQLAQHHSRSRRDVPLLLPG
jgi:uncharacterized protein YcnI